MNIKKLKVKPRKEYSKGVCGLQLASMLGCWATSNDIHSVGPCQDAAKALFECMRSTPTLRKGHGSTINYHLMRLGKNLK
ncbi:uncharacterized protein LAESUDRAFT_643166 [Laetiporus sulphureus 93-53]|uniref:CHCH domain-containing protein n=1 Tax=Laetiporus sulphureus 93-53 TaxID=1314785 RepID=A0A165HAW8_9APHY|nr:uncharacterized protein LAESUDRAFT_643166 [Laetiporus sulphureus 93-53]KZT11483.1 hypothetical protein LAESUDRAFT_643166 [Laetiporus sulphureus 93-53]